MDNIELDEYRPAARIVVIGVGGGGSNAVERMIDDNIGDIEFYVFNTDKQSLANSHVSNRYVLGKNVTQGLGAGGVPQVGLSAAQDSENEIRDIVSGANMVFIAAGMGGGTGTGAAPFIAHIAKEEGAVTVAIVTRPFSFEGKKRINQSIDGLNELKKEVDSLIVVSNDKLLMLNGNAKVTEAFSIADGVLSQSVKTITDLIFVPSIINSDFADVRNVLRDSGVSLIGFGTGSGPNKTIDAAMNALNCPLLEADIRGARRGICSVTVGTNVTLYEAQETVNRIIEAAGDQMDIKFSISVNEQLDDTIIASVIASDFVQEIDFRSNLSGNRFIMPTQPIQEPSSQENISFGENNNLPNQEEPKKVEVEGVDQAVSSDILSDFLKTGMF